MTAPKATYTVAIRDALADCYKPAPGIPLMSRDKAEALVASARVAGMDCVTFNTHAE